MYLVVIELEDTKGRYYLPLIHSEEPFKTERMAEFETLEQIRKLKAEHVFKRTLWYAFNPLYLKAWEII